MSTICCLTAPPNTTSPSTAKDNSNIIFNRHLSCMSPSITSPSLRTESADLAEYDHLHDHEKLLLPHSTRHLKRRTSIFEKSRDWARRFLTLHRSRCNTISNEKLRRSCYDFHRKTSIGQVPCSSPIELPYQKSFDEDGYLSPMEINAQLDNIAREKTIPSGSSLSKFSSHSQHLLVYSQSNTDISQTIYRCHGPMTHSAKCTCPTSSEVPRSRTSYLSDFHRSLSVVDYIDDDVAEESISPSPDRSPQDDDDPVMYLKYLFEEKSSVSSSPSTISITRRPPRRTTNTSSISTDSGYCDLPMTSSNSSSSSASKLIPVHLISCTLIPVNVTRTDPVDIHYLACTCSASTSMYTAQRTTAQRKSSNLSYRFPSRSQIEIIDQPCSCHPKYYTPTTTTHFSPKGPAHHKPNPQPSREGRRKQLRKKRASQRRLPIVHDDLSAVSRWYKPYLDRDAVCQALQQADYGAFILRDSTTHRDCYALSVKVPKFTHDANIAHYLIERVLENQSYSYRIKGTIKQFPTLISLLTHHSVMPEILPITLNLHETIAI